MSDEFRIPAVIAAPGGRGPVSASYRARRAGPDMGMLPLKLAAAGLFGLLLLGTVGWAVMGRRPVAVPVIEADSSPIRVKPDNPGGLQVAGAEETGDPTGAGDRMAPVAESPAPQALRAQMRPGPQAMGPQAMGPQATDAPTEVPTGGVAPAVVGLAPAAAVPAQPGRDALAGSTVLPPGASVPDTPARAVPGKPAASIVVPAAPLVAAAPAKPASGAMLVQLGALGSESAAQVEWQRLVRGMPELLDGHQPSIQKTEHDGHTLWRLRTGGFADVADATGFCVKLHAKGGTCTIASF